MLLDIWWAMTKFFLCRSQPKTSCPTVSSSGLFLDRILRNKISVLVAVPASKAVHLVSTGLNSLWPSPLSQPGQELTRTHVYVHYILVHTFEEESGLTDACMLCSTHVYTHTKSGHRQAAEGDNLPLTASAAASLRAKFGLFTAKGSNIINSNCTSRPTPSSNNWACVFLLSFSPATTHAV